MSSDEKRIEHTQPDAGDHGYAGKPIITPEDNARHERQQKLDMAKSFRLTTDKNNSFTLDMGDGKHVKDNRPVWNQDSLLSLGEAEYRNELSGKPITKFSAEFPVELPVELPGAPPLGPGAMSSTFRAEESSRLSNQSDLAYQLAEPLSTEKVRELAEQIQHNKEQPTSFEVFVKMHEAVSMSADTDGRMAGMDHLEHQPAVVDQVSEKMVGGEASYELQNGIQVMHQKDSASLSEQWQVAQAMGGKLTALQASEKLPDERASSDSMNIVTNSERLPYVRPEQQGRRLAEEILRGDFQAFTYDRNVEKFQFTSEQLKTLQETFQQVIAEQQFNAVHRLNCTSEEAAQRLHNINQAVKASLLDSEQIKCIEEKYELLEINWSHITDKQ